MAAKIAENTAKITDEVDADEFSKFCVPATGL